MAATRRSMPSAYSTTQFGDVCNWGRWGEDDLHGTLNHVTSEVRHRAARLVRSGDTVSCSWPVLPEDRFPATPETILPAGTINDTWINEHGDVTTVWDVHQVSYHGSFVTHVDALSHVAWDGLGYGGRAFELGSSNLGDVAVLGGAFTRGVLIDLARHRNVDAVSGGEFALPEELDDILEQERVELQTGDFVLLRTGWDTFRATKGRQGIVGANRPGWHYSSLSWLQQHEVSLIGCDVPQDVVPAGIRSPFNPIHTVGIVMMGLWLVDNCDLRELASVCASLKRYEFAISLSPIPVLGASGGPVNPLAVF